MTTPAMSMSEETFWGILERLDWRKTGDDEAVLEPAVIALSALSEADVTKFEDFLAEKLFALDTREHARFLYLGQVDPDDGDQYISPDQFLYQRCAVVANGRACFESALKKPTEMTAFQDIEFESLLSLGQAAYLRKTGKELDHVTPLSCESFSNKAGWRPTPRTKPGRFTGTGVPLGNRRPT